MKEGSDENRRRELEAELERHKALFLAASRRGIEAMRKDVSILNWIVTYPVQSAWVAFLGGLCLGLVKPLDRHKDSSLV